MREARRLLQARRPDRAAVVAQRHLERHPEDADALYVLAVARRYLHRPGDALGPLARLKALRPGYGRAHQEEGHSLRALGRPAEAVVAYARAVRANPALPASWRALVELHRADGRHGLAGQAAEQARRLEALPRELLSVASMLHEGRLYRAERLCRAWLKRYPKDVEAMRLLADIGVRLKVYDDAEFLLESALAFEPGNQRVRLDYVNVLHRRQKFSEAHAQAAALRSGEDNPAWDLVYANECVAIGDFDTALALYDELLGRAPGQPGTWLVRGHALKTVGRLDEAVESYRRAADARPGFGDAWWSLANLKTYRFDDDELARMRRLLRSRELDDVDRYHLQFALGKALEDHGDYDASFAAYAEGNALKRAELRYDPARLEDEMAAQRATFTREFLDARAGWGCAAPDPIFIVGLPRAGSTLLEQILASHPQVDGTMELPQVLALAHRLNGRRVIGDEARYPGVLAGLDAAQLRAHGEAFIRDTRIHRGDAPYFIDKMPNNFRHLGLIRLILPNAKIIDARRGAMACCFSGYKQLFAEGQEFSYGLSDLGRYYRGYVELMEHWDAVAPGAVLRVRYEDVVADLEGQVRRLLAFLGLPFHRACLAFHRTRRPVRTPSSEQVRQPIHAGGLAQWRHFEAHLGPLREALGDLASRP